MSSAQTDDRPQRSLSLEGTLNRSHPLPETGGNTPRDLMPLGIAFLSGLALMTPVVFILHQRHTRKIRDQRALLGDELHDQLGPMIYYSRMLLTNELRQHAAPSESMLELQNQLTQTGETVRDLSRTLRHKSATSLQDLEAVLAMQLERWHQLGTGAYVVHGEVPDLMLSLVQYTQLLRVLQELMLNSCRHAPGQSIHLAFESGRRRLRLRYWDDGPGFGPCLRSGTGSSSTASRMDRIGGSLELSNRYPDGYEIILNLPL